jgi:hypothetical protein
MLETLNASTPVEFTVVGAGMPVNRKRELFPKIVSFLTWVVAIAVRTVGTCTVFLWGA